MFFFDVMDVKADNEAVNNKTKYYHQRLRKFYFIKTITIKFNLGFFYVCDIAYISPGHY